MRKGFSILAGLVLLFKTADAQIVSNFTSDDEGWTIADINNNNPQTVIYTGTGGNTGGYVSMTTANANAMYWSAPSKFMGNRAYTSYGETITIDVQTAAAPAQIAHGPNGDIMIRSGTYSIWANFTSLPTASNTWTTLSIKVDEIAGAWKTIGITGLTATRQDIMNALTNVTEMRIFVQWAPGSNILGGLDNVTMNVHPADPPAPSITSFSPMQATPGADVTINGTNFGSSPANNVVYFGALKANIVSASATSIIATVPAGADYGPPMVLNTTTHLSTVARQNFIPTRVNGGGRLIKGSFMPDVLFNRNVGILAHGDVNGDGRPEMLASYGTSISIFENKSTPGTIDVNSFATIVNIDPSLPSGYSEIGMDDLDGDGKKDIFVAFRDNPDAGRMLLLRNIHTSGAIGPGSFATAQEITAPVYTVYAASSADFDGDGRPELMTWGSSCGANPVYIFQNVSVPGDLRFTGVITLSGINSCGSRYSIADLDGDGKLDIVQSSGGDMRIFRNTSTPGSLSFDAGFDLGAGGTTNAIGDLDNDGKPDIVFSSGGMKIFKNISTPGSLSIASFQGPVTFAGGVTAVKIADMNGDGKPDIVSGTFNGVGVYENVTPDGQLNTSSFLPIVPVKSDRNATDIDVFDVDVDGRPDIICNNANFGTISVNQNIISSPPTITNISPKTGAPGSIVTITGTDFSPVATDNTVYFGAAIATVNNATATSLEVVVPAGATYNQVSVALRGFTLFSPQYFTPTFSGGSAFVTSSFSAPFDITLNNASDGISLMDYDGDGKVDMLVDNSGVATAFRNTGNNGVIDATTFATPYQAAVQGQHILGADINGDGKPDLASTTYMFRNTSSSALPNPIAFDAQVTRDNGGVTRYGNPRDLNNDGKIDMIYTGGDVNIYYSENQSRSGPFITAGDALSTIATYNSQPKPVANGYCVVADFDGDGFNDIAATSGATNNFTVYLNTGLGGTLSNASFNTGVHFTTNDNPARIAALDFDGDGKIDVAIANNINGPTATISLFRNTSTTGNINFDRQDFAAATGPTDIVAADMDGDGKPDLVVTNVNDKSFSVFRNTSTMGAISTSSFAAKVDYTLPTQPLGLAVADIDRDMRPDVVVTRSTNIVSIFKNVAPLGPIISFTTQPVSVTACENGTATYNVAATGANNLTYAWQMFNTATSTFNDLTNDSNYSGVNTSTLTLSSITPVMNGATYRVRVNGDAASEKISDQATITVSTSPAAPGTSGGTNCKGSSVTLTADGSTDGNYRWYDSPTSQHAINGEVNATFQTPVIFQTTSFYAAIANADGCVSARTEAIATITPLTKPSITPDGTLLCGLNAVTISGPAGFAQYHWSSGESTQDIEISSTGSYSLIVEDANGCKSLSSDPAVITAGSVAKPVIDASKNHLCAEGDQIVLTAPEDFAGYEWSNGATTQSITVTTAGTYNVAVTNSSGCRSETSDDVLIDAGADKPLISVGSDVLVSTPAKTYQWYYGDAKIPDGTKQFLKYNPFQYGSYTVSVTDLSDCEATSDPFVNLVTAVEEAGANEFVYPNPFTTKLIVNDQATLFDATGKPVRTLIKGDNDVSQLSQGLYLVMIRKDNQLKLIKVTK